jgi:predicted double-glycine peptidase
MTKGNVLTQKVCFERLPNIVTSMYPLNKCVMRVICVSNNHRMLVTKIRLLFSCAPTT